MVVLVFLFCLTALILADHQVQHGNGQGNSQQPAQSEESGQVSFQIKSFIFYGFLQFIFFLKIYPFFIIFKFLFFSEQPLKKSRRL
jgi:hypothetical protein